MKKLPKIVMCAAAVAAFGVTSASAFAGCGSQADEVRITGSSSVSPLMQKLAEAYEEKIGEENVIRITTSDSGAGIGDARQGKNDFGMASRALKSTETGVVSKKICDDGIALIVNPNAELENVTAEEVYGLYHDHTAVGGVVNAISREDGSGTRGAFDELIKSGGESLSETGLYAGVVKLNSTGSVIERIAANSAATEVGYVSMGSLTAAVLATVKPLSLGGVAPSAENVVNGTYALSRPFNIVYQSEDGLSGAAKAFIDFILGSEGQAIVRAEGYIAL